MKRHRTMQKLRKALAVLFTLCLALSFAPAALADDGTGGSCGENVTWTPDADTGVLTISGTGDMEDYASDSDVPWYSQRDAATIHYNSTSSDDGTDIGHSGDTLMIRRGTTMYFNYSLKGGNADFSITAGEATDQVLAGDWDGDGIDTVCLRRGNVCYFIDDITTMHVYLTVTYGRSGDEVLVGDWDGDGCDSLAMRRNGNYYYFCNDITDPDGDTWSATYGRAADEIHVGDWEGNGYDSLAVRRDGNYYYFSLSKVTDPNGDVWVTTFGRAGDEVLVGDWDGDGTDSLAMRRDGNVYYISNSIATPDSGVDTFTFGRATDEVYAGKWKSEEKTLVTDSLDSMSKPVSDAMDLLYYAQQEMSLGAVSTSGTSMVRSFKGNAADYDVLCAYVELLCDEYDFELVSDPYYKALSSTFVEFDLNYTGAKNMIGSGIDGVYTDNVGDVMIYAQIKRDSLEGAMWYDSALEPGNDGYVYGSSSGGSCYIGDSFAVGLYRLADGSFQTTDGRLTAAVGEAMMITDGSSTTYVSDYIYDNDDNRQEIYVKNKYGTEQQVIYIPTTVTLATDQIYDSSYFIIESDWATKTRGISSNVPPYTWTAMFACLHDGEYNYPVRGLSGVMTDVNVRVMYVDESIAVFYTCAQFESEPYEVETLIAVPIGLDTVVENQPDGEYTISVGNYVDISGPYKYDTGYNLWSWEFVYGDSLATLTGANAQICRITGTSAGEVRVRVTYSYSIKEPDVLTGIERSVSHSTSQEFVITIK